MLWTNSHRADISALPLADRHYNRQKIGSPQFVPPGRCLVFLTEQQDALWVSSAPFAEYVKHAWAGAWVNTLFRNESPHRASDLIRFAVAATLYHWPDPPDLGFVSFVDPRHVKPTYRRGQPIYGYCYLKAGWRHVGFTKAGLWTMDVAVITRSNAVGCGSVMAIDFINSSPPAACSLLDSAPPP